MKQKFEITYELVSTILEEKVIETFANDERGRASLHAYAKGWGFKKKRVQQLIDHPSPKYTFIRKKDGYISKIFTPVKQ